VVNPDVAEVRRRLTGAATVGGYRLGAMAARLLPDVFSESAAMSIGLSANVASPAKRRMISRHLQRVNPRLRGPALRNAVQQAFDNYARYYIESFKLPTLPRDVVHDNFTVDGFENVTAAFEKGDGVILALPHLGGWEWAGRWMTDHGYPMTVVVEALDPPELFEWFADLRKDLGMTIVPTGPKAGPAVLRALRNGEIVSLLSDRDLDRSGVPVTFFGERTTLPAGPATLGFRTGAPILPLAVYFAEPPNGHHAVVRAPLPMERTGGLREDVARVTQLMADQLADLIRAAPEQWHLFQPNWPSDPGYHD
jgi:KDO2-lipid IV(A) lauroyltransferase